MKTPVPLDIILHVLDELKERSDKPAIAKMREVSREIEVEAAKRLYATLAYDNIPGTALSWDLRQNLTPLHASFVREFVLYSSIPGAGENERGWFTLCDIVKSLCSMPRLRVVRLHSIQLLRCVWLCNDPTSCIAQCMLARLEHFEVVNVGTLGGGQWIHPLALLKITDAADSLMISLSRAEINTLPAHLVQHMQAMKIGTFAIDLSGVAAPVNRVEPILVPRVRILEVYDVSRRNADVLAQAIRSTSPILETLRIRFNWPDVDSGTGVAWIGSVDMQQCLSLTRVSVMLPPLSPHSHVDYSTAVVQILPKHNLVLELAFPFPFENVDAALSHFESVDWYALSRALKNRPNIHTLVITWVSFTHADFGVWDEGVCQGICSALRCDAPYLEVKFFADRCRAFYEREGIRRFSYDIFDTADTVYNSAKNPLWIL